MAKRSRRQRIARAAAAPAPQPHAPVPSPAPRRETPRPKRKAAPVVIEMAPEEDIVVSVSYDGMTKTELQELCDAKGIAYCRMTAKSTLIKLLKG